MGNKNEKNVKMVIVGKDGKHYDSLDEVFQEIKEKLMGDEDTTPDTDEQEDFDPCEDCPGCDLKEMADEAYAVYTAFQQAGFTPEQAFELLLAGLN